MRFIRVNELKLTQVKLFSFFHFMRAAANASELFYVAHLGNIEWVLLQRESLPIYPCRVFELKNDLKRGERVFVLLHFPIQKQADSRFWCKKDIENNAQKLSLYYKL